MLMTESEFWTIIEKSIPPDLADFDGQLERLETALSKLRPAEIISFQDYSDRKLAEAYRFDLWGAAYLINGGCCDDGFDYFVQWLISRGQQVFEAACRDPDTLADLCDIQEQASEFEEFGYVAQRVYESKTGSEFPERPWSRAEKPLGDEWNFDDMNLCRQRLPKLAARFTQ
jgi:hypothetical protein